MSKILPDKAKVGGLDITVNTPSPTTEMLYNIGGILYFSGGTLVHGQVYQGSDIGTGSEVRYTHGLSGKPQLVSVVPSTAGQSVYVRATSTYLYINVSDGESFTYSAIYFS